jgi:hypothetical protein
MLMFAVGSATIILLGFAVGCSIALAAAEGTWPPLGGR